MDITNANLEAAIIDQKVAGAFPRKTYAYVAVVDNKGWALGVAVANEQGYTPVIGKTFDKEREAREWAESLNQHIGLTRFRVMDIVVSTMGGRPAVVSK